MGIPGVSMRYVLNKSLRWNPDIKLYAPGEPCKHKCKDPCFKCMECTKNEAYELLQTGMVGGLLLSFVGITSGDVTGLRSHVYENPKLCKTVPTCFIPVP